MRTSLLSGAVQLSVVRTPPVVVRRALFERLSAGVAGGVTLISAPPGSGKTVLLRSWIEHAGSPIASRGCRSSAASATRSGSGSRRSSSCAPPPARTGSSRSSTPTPAFNGDAVVERLVSELGSLDEPVVLVIDDLHELSSPEALAQLERLLARRPPLLRVVLATRHDPQLGLHRLRLAGQLTEVRAADLRFTLEETRELLAASGIALSDEGVALLHARTEGWAAGLRLAALFARRPPRPRAIRRRVLRQRAHRRRLPAGRGARASARGGAAAAAAHVDPRAGERPARRRPRRSLRLGADPARARASERLRRLARRRAVVVPLPPPLRRPPAPGAAPDRAGRRRAAAPGCGRVVRGARVRGRRDPARPGRRGLVARRPPARRPHRPASCSRARTRPSARCWPRSRRMRSPIRSWTWSSRVINWSAGRSTTRRRTSPSPSGTPPRCPTSGGTASSCCSRSRGSRSPSGAATSAPSSTTCSRCSSAGGGGHVGRGRARQRPQGASR